MMKKLFLNILFMILALALSACSQSKPVKQNFKFKISAIATGLPLNGGSFVNALTGSNLNLVKLDENLSADFPVGIYEFQTVSFEGPSAFTGKKYCGIAKNINLSQSEKNVTMNITEANCLTEPFISLISKILKDFKPDSSINLYSVLPNTGALSGGATITISGSNFLTGATVSIGGSVCSSVNVLNATSLTCITPAHIVGSVDITVTNPDSQLGSLSSAFIYRAAPIISSVFPVSGASSGGASVQINGSEFYIGLTVDFGGSPCHTVNIISSNVITCTTNSHAPGLVNVKVINADSQFSIKNSAYNFALPPSITNISPTMGLITGGTFLTISGSNFVSSATVSIGGTPCLSVNVLNPTSLTCITQPHANGFTNIIITNPDSQSNSTSPSFSYNAPLSITSISPASGVVTGGTVVQISGSGFYAGATVRLGGALCTSVNIINSSSISCTAPSHGGGIVAVKVTNIDSQFSEKLNAYTYHIPFITTWKTNTSGSANPNQIELPLAADGVYNFEVDWGDGVITTITTWNAPGKIHNYATPGNYSVTMTGVYDRIRFEQTSTPEKILDVTQWGTNKWETMEMAFRNCSNLQITASDTPNLSKVSNMHAMFQDATVFNSNIGNWNTSNVNNMSATFLDASAFNKPIGTWNTSKVTNMNLMFGGATSFNQDIGIWDTSIVAYMNGTFQNATSFNQDLGSWNTINVVNMGFMFNGASSFNQNIDDWNTSNLAIMNNMFFGAAAFNQDLHLWNILSVTDHANYDVGATLWDTINKPQF